MATSWKELADSGSVTTEQLRCVDHDGAGTLVAAGQNGAILKSTDDGKTWALSAESGSSKFADRTDGIVFGPGPDLWAIVVVDGNNDITFSSPDGDSWTSRSSSGGTQHALEFGNGKYASVGWDANIKTSTDGVSWTENETSIADNTRAVGTDGNGLWSAGGANGQLILSTDNASTWSVATDSEAHASDWIRGIHWADGQFVAVGDNGKIQHSTDGDNWTEATDSGSVTTERLRDVAYGNGVWIVVGDNGTIIESADGDSWTIVGSGVTADTLLGVSFVADSGSFIAVGGNGTLLQGSDTDAVVGRLTISGLTLAASGGTVPDIDFGDQWGQYAWGVDTWGTATDAPDPIYADTVVGRLRLGPASIPQAPFHTPQQRERAEYALLNTGVNIVPLNNQSDYLLLNTTVNAEAVVGRIRLAGGTSEALFVGYTLGSAVVNAEAQAGDDALITWDETPTGTRLDFEVFRRNPSTGERFDPDADTAARIAQGIDALEYLDAGLDAGDYDWQVFARVERD